MFKFAPLVSALFALSLIAGCASTSENEEQSTHASPQPVKEATKQDAIPQATPAPAPEKKKYRISERPMFAGIRHMKPTSPQIAKMQSMMQAADKRFIDGVLKLGMSRSQASDIWAMEGWKFLLQKQSGTATLRFNQAWILDEENPAPYHGFALVSFMRNAPDKVVEKYFKLALGKEDAEASVNTDYGAFLHARKRYDEAVAQYVIADEKEPNSMEKKGYFALLFGDKDKYKDTCEALENAAAQKGEQAKGLVFEGMCGKK